MADDPVSWLAEHWQVGVNLREEGWELRTQEEASAWHEHELQWAKELRDGIAARHPRDVPRVETLDQIYVFDLPEGHPWRGITNSPLNCHATRVDRAKEIETEWRAAVPGQPKLPKAASTATLEEFENWYHARAAKFASESKQSSREEDRKVASNHFKQQVPWDWIINARRALPDDHPFRKKGRRTVA